MSSKHPKYKSLWLHQQKKAVPAQLSRWSDYPYFTEMLAEEGVDIDSDVTVRWGSLKQWTKFMIEADSDEQAADVEGFVADVAAEMQDGEDIPPVIRRGKNIVDGRHRAFAADLLDIYRGPIVDLARANPGALPEGFDDFGDAESGPPMPEQLQRFRDLQRGDVFCLGNKKLGWVVVKRLGDFSVWVHKDTQAGRRRKDFVARYHPGNFIEVFEGAGGGLDIVGEAVAHGSISHVAVTSDS